MNPHIIRSQLTSRLPRLVPFIFIVAINATSLVVFPRVGMSVGAEFGNDGYKEIAENIVSGGGFGNWSGRPSTMMFGSMKREPLYPLWLAGILSVTGSLSPVVLCCFQTALALVSCWLLYRLGARMFNPEIGTLASYVYAVHPISFWYATRFASENIAIPVILLCLLAIERFFEEVTPQRAFWVGVSLGIATLTKSAFVVLTPLVLLFALVRIPKSRQFSLCATVLICSFLSVHSLWLIRNYRISGAVVPFTTMNGVIFFVGNSIVEQFDPTTLTAGNEPERRAEALYASVQADIGAKQPWMPLPRLEVETDKQLREMGRRFVLERPLFIAKKVLAGMVFIWFVSDSTAKSWGWAIFQFPLLMLAFVGIWAHRSWTSNLLLLITFTVVFLLAYAIVSPYARYALAVCPVVILFASEGIATVAKLSLQLRSRPIEIQV